MLLLGTRQSTCFIEYDLSTQFYGTQDECITYLVKLYNIEVIILDSYHYKIKINPSSGLVWIKLRKNISNGIYTLTYPELTYTINNIKYYAVLVPNNFNLPVSA